MPEDDRPVPPIVVKKYANRRLYDTESSIYITLDTLADMVRHGRDFVVYDAKTGDDITRSVLTQIIMEEETRGRNMLPTAFLRQLIGFYGDSMQGLVPDYLERVMEQFSLEQHQGRASMQRTIGAFRPSGVEEVGRQNLAMMDRAMRSFPPFYHAAPDGSPPDPATETRGEFDELAALREEVGRLRGELAHANAELDDKQLGKPLVAQAIRGGVRH